MVDRIKNSSGLPDVQQNDDAQFVGWPPYMRKALTYIAWTLGISWSLGFVLFSLIDDSEIIPFTLASLFFGFIPAFVALVFNRKEGGTWVDLKFVRPGLKNAISAFLVPLVFFGLIYFTQYYFGIRSVLDPSKAGAPLELGLSMLFGFPILLLLVLGEEIGWRGYLQEQLIQSFGNLRGVVVLGLVWGLWHLPVAIHGYNLPNYPLVESFITYPLLGVALSLVIAYIGFNRYSIWIGAILHASNNHFGGFMLALTDTKDEWYHAMTFVVLYTIMIILFGYLYYKRTKTAS